MERYQRQQNISNWDTNAQELLSNARVCVIGCGGLGIPVSTYLTMVGIGTLGLIDFDIIQASNLNRQFFYSDYDIGELKVRTLRKRLSELNPLITLHEHNIFLSNDNVEFIFSQYDIFILAVDNLETRECVGRAAYNFKKLLIDGSVIHETGYLTAYIPDGSACYFCLHHSQNLPKEHSSQIVGTVAGVLGTLMAQEVVNVVIHHENTLKHRLLVFEGADLSLTEIHFDKKNDCKLCRNLSTQIDSSIQLV